MHIRVNNKALFVAAATLIAAVSAGCVSYTPSQLSSLATVDLCELRANQGMNLSQESRSALQSELQRRHDDCQAHAAVLAQRREEALYREMYGKHDDP